MDRPSLRRIQLAFNVDNDLLHLAGPRGPAFIAATARPPTRSSCCASPVHVDRPSLRQQDVRGRFRNGVTSPVHVDRPSLRRDLIPAPARKLIYLAGPRGPAFIAATAPPAPSVHGCNSLAGPRGPAFIAAFRISVHASSSSRLAGPRGPAFIAASHPAPDSGSTLPRRSTWTGLHCGVDIVSRLPCPIFALAGPRGPAFIAATQTADPTRRQRSLAGPRGPAFIAARRRWSSGQRRQAASPVHVDRPSLRRVKLGFDVDDNLLPRRSTWTGLHCGNSLDQGTQDLIIPRRSTWTGLHCGHAVDELGVVR